MKTINNIFTISINNILIKKQISNESLFVLLLWEIYAENQDLLLEKIAKTYEENIDKLTELLLKLEWLFIIIIYDKINEKLIIINDKLWLKPFYIYNNWIDIIYGENFLKLVKNIDKKEVNNEAIFEILSLWYLTNWKTIVKWINNLKSWTINIISNNWIESKSYYKIIKKKNITNEEIYESFYNWLKKRIDKFENINCALSGWYDTRFIIWNIIKIKWSKNINAYTNNVDDNDVEISKIIAKNLWIKHSIIDYNEQEKNIINIIESKLSNINIDYDNQFLSGICGWEILWNALWKDWFIADNIEWYINKNYKYNEIEENIIKWKSIYEYWIKSFVENILRTNLNAVEWFWWVNPSSYFLGNGIYPFCDSEFITNIYSKEVDEIKNYKTYTDIYKKYLPKLLDIKYTHNTERENEKIDENNYFVSKNYIITKKDYKLLVYLAVNMFKKNNVLNNLINPKIITIKPLEVLILLLQLKIIES